MFAELIVRAFHARTLAHLLHLTSPTYARHIALNEFYDGIVELADSLCEAWQGREKKLISAGAALSKCRCTMSDDPVKMITEFRDWVDENRYDAVPAEMTHLHNMIDEIVSLCDSTLYKLTFLR